MKKLIVALLFAVLCSAFLVPVASAHTAQRQTGCVNYPPGWPIDQYDNPCPPSQEQQGPGVPSTFCNDPSNLLGCNGNQPPDTSQPGNGSSSGSGQPKFHFYPPQQQGSGGSTSCPVNPNTGLNCHGQPQFYCLGGDKCNGKSTGRGHLSDNAIQEEILSCAQDLTAEALDAFSGGAPAGDILVHGVKYAYKVTNYAAIRARHAILLVKLWNTSDPNQQSDIAVSMLWNELQIIPGIGCAPLLQRILNTTEGQIGIKIGQWIRKNWLHQP